LLRVLNDLVGKQKIVRKVILGLANIDFDIKPLVGFCCEHDLIEELIHVCT
jgi:hypothetical protein